MTYFGTDGIRDKAEQFTPEFLAKIIRGLIDHAGDAIKVMLGGDTRESTEWILQDLSQALETFGIEYSSVGILPTPAINYCFYEMGFDYAIDVTASHNPYTDNGIKIFERGKSSGQKLNQSACETIEKSLASPIIYTPSSTTYREDLHTEALELYKNHLKEYLGPTDLTGLTLAIDCANGATSVIGDSIFTELGAEAQLIHATPSYNTIINKDCGSTYLESLQNLVKENHLDLGIAFDGDGDRCLLIDEEGSVVDGDQIIAIIANHLHLDQIAVTVMANQGLLNWAKTANITTEITAVGDSNVAEAMRTKNIQVGGEQSGHIILPGEPTGDGMLTALMITKIISETNQSLQTLTSLYQKSPQVVVNMPATPEQKQTLKTSEKAKQLLLDFSKKLESEHGRLLVRPSGTEPLIRITLWGDNQNSINALANQLKDELEKTL